MRLTIVGSGGCVPLPRPGCLCAVCSKARQKGIPYARSGPAMYVHDEAILFDTPEEVTSRLNQEGIHEVRHVFYTHWHPDHTFGMRLFEHLRSHYDNEPALEPIPVYTPDPVYDDITSNIPAFSFFERQGYIKAVKLADNETAVLESLSIQAIPTGGVESNRYIYLITDRRGGTALYAPCDVCGIRLENVAQCRGVDLLLLECWVPITGQQRKGLPHGHAWQTHLSEEEGLALLDYLRPRRTILVHIDGARHRSPEIDHDILLEIVRSYPHRVEIAYDGMRLVL